VPIPRPSAGFYDFDEYERIVAAAKAEGHDGRERGGVCNSAPAARGLDRCRIGDGFDDALQLAGEVGRFVGVRSQETPYDCGKVWRPS
jgi:hypothetical protein